MLTNGGGHAEAANRVNGGKERAHARMQPAQAPRSGPLLGRHASGDGLNGWHHVRCAEDSSDSTWQGSSLGSDRSSEAGTDERSSTTADLSSPPSAGSVKQGGANAGACALVEANGHCRVSSCGGGTGKGFSTALFPEPSPAVMAPPPPPPPASSSGAHVWAGVPKVHLVPALRQCPVQTDSLAAAEGRLGGGAAIAQGSGGRGGPAASSALPGPAVPSPSVTGPGEALLPLEVPLEARQQAAPAAAAAAASQSGNTTAPARRQHARPSGVADGEAAAQASQERGSVPSQLADSAAASSSSAPSWRGSDAQLEGVRAPAGNSAAAAAAAASAQPHAPKDAGGSGGHGTGQRRFGVDPNLVLEIQHRLSALTTKSQKRSEPAGWPQQPMSAPAPRREQPHRAAHVQQQQQQPLPPPQRTNGAPLRTQSMPKLPEQAAHGGPPQHPLLRNGRTTGSILDHWQAPPQLVPRPAQSRLGLQQQQQAMQFVPGSKQAAVQHIESLRRLPKPASLLEGLRPPQSPASYAAVQQQQHELRSAELQQRGVPGQQMLPRPAMGAYSTAAAHPAASAALAAQLHAHRSAPTAMPAPVAFASAPEAPSLPASAAQQTAPHLATGQHARLSRGTPAERLPLPTSALQQPPSMSVKLSSAGQAQLQERQAQQAMLAASMLPPPPPPVLTRAPPAINRQSSAQV